MASPHEEEAKINASVKGDKGWENDEELDLEESNNQEKEDIHLQEIPQSPPHRKESNINRSDDDLLNSDVVVNDPFGGSPPEQEPASNLAAQGCSSQGGT